LRAFDDGGSLGRGFKEIEIRSESEDAVPFRPGRFLEKARFLQLADSGCGCVVDNPQLLLRGLNVGQGMTEQELKQFGFVRACMGHSDGRIVRSPCTVIPRFTV
jgi:hypothetical protein